MSQPEKPLVIRGLWRRHSAHLRRAWPEPSTWAMLLIGFAGLGYAAIAHAIGAPLQRSEQEVNRTPQGPSASRSFECAWKAARPAALEELDSVCWRCFQKSVQVDIFFLFP
jgi:hypothetical protein